MEQGEYSNKSSIEVRLKMRLILKKGLSKLDFGIKGVVVFYESCDFSGGEGVSSCSYYQ